MNKLDLDIKLATNQEVLSWSNGEVTSYDIVSDDEIKYIKGGLYSSDIFGDIESEKIGHIKLLKPIINPLFINNYLKDLAPILNKNYEDLKKLVYSKVGIDEEGNIVELYEQDVLTGTEALEKLLKNVINLDSVVIDIIPVMSPKYRPVDGELNEQYRKVMIRNKRVVNVISLNAPKIIIRNEIRMLQEAVDKLFDNHYVIEKLVK